MSSLPHFLLYIGAKNIYPAQEGSIWRKIRKTGCDFPDFCVNIPTVQKSNFLSSTTEYMEIDHNA